MNKKKVSVAASVAAAGIITAVIFFLLQRLVVPKYMGEIREGALISEYYKEEKDFDVIFIGDCEVYENFVPAVLWEEYGINSYIRGSAQQLIWQSYYLMEETLKYETPDVMVFNILSLQYDEPQKEAYNRMTLDGMRWSHSKAESIRASMLKEESFIEYVFPILRYHSRISELENADFKYCFRKDKVGDNGYYMQVGINPVEYIPEGKVLGDYSFGENAWRYLDKMTELCKKKGVKLVLIKAPSLYPVWYDEWEVQVKDYADANDLDYINFLKLSEETGIDYDTDTYDAGLHLNLYGARKLTSYFGEYLSGDCGLSDRRKEAHLSELWDKKLKDYYEREEALLSEKKNNN